MTKNTMLVTAIASFTPRPAFHMLDCVRALKGNEKAFLIFTLDEAIDYHLDPKCDTSFGRTLRHMLTGLQNGKDRITELTAMRAVLEYVKEYEKKHGPVTHAFVDGLMPTPQHVDAALKSFEDCIELVAVGSPGEGDAALSDAVEVFIARTGNAIMLSPGREPVLQMENFFERTMLSDESIKYWRDCCADTSHPAHRILYRDRLHAAAESAPQPMQAVEGLATAPA